MSTISYVSSISNCLSCEIFTKSHTVFFVDYALSALAWISVIAYISIFCFPFKSSFLSIQHATFFSLGRLDLLFQYSFIWFQYYSLNKSSLDDEVHSDLTKLSWIGNGFLFSQQTKD